MLFAVLIILCPGDKCVHSELFVAVGIYLFILNNHAPISAGESKLKRGDSCSRVW